MKKLLAFLVLVAAGVAHAQTYDIDIQMYLGATPEAFTGSLTYSNGVLTNVDVSDSFGGAFTTGYVTNSTLISLTEMTSTGTDFLDLTLDQPVGFTGTTSFSDVLWYSFPNTYVWECSVSHTGPRSPQCPVATMTSVPATSVPEIDWSRAVAALTLLAGGALVLKSSRPPRTV